MVGMNIYLLEQDENWGYDTYSSCVVCAVSEEDAKKIHPDGLNEFIENNEDKSWASTKDKIKCTFIGTAAPNVVRGVVCANFYSGYA